MHLDRKFVEQRAGCEEGAQSPELGQEYLLSKGNST